MWKTTSSEDTGLGTGSTSGHSQSQVLGGGTVCSWYRWCPQDSTGQGAVECVLPAHLIQCLRLQAVPTPQSSVQLLRAPGDGWPPQPPVVLTPQSLTVSRAELSSAGPHVPNSS